MPRRLGPRLDDLISRLAYRAMPIAANVYKTWPNLADGTGVAASPNWTEMVNAANAPTVPFTIALVYTYGGGIGGTIELGAGPLGSEVAIAAYAMSNYTIGTFGIPQPPPIIPGGSRVVARQLGGSPTAVKIVTAVLPPRLDPFNTLMLASKLSSYYPGISAMNVVTGTVTAGAGAWTYGNYLEMWAAAVESHPVIITSVGVGVSTNAIHQLQAAFAIGGAGLEVIWGEFPAAELDGSSHTIPLLIPLIVPGSTRHAVKTASTAGGIVTYWPTLGLVKAAYLP